MSNAAPDPTEKGAPLSKSWNTPVTYGDNVSITLNKPGRGAVKVTIVNHSKASVTPQFLWVESTSGDQPTNAEAIPSVDLKPGQSTSFTLKFASNPGALKVTWKDGATFTYGD